MIRLHHLIASRSERILWLLEELELPYEVVAYPRDPVTRMAPPSLLAIHPLGKSPIVTDGDLVLAESGAIVEYFLDRHDPEGRLATPPGSADHLRHRYWMHFAEGSMALPFVMYSLIAPAGDAAAKARDYCLDQFRRQLDFIETALGEAPWFSGARIGGADIMNARYLRRIDALDTAVPRPRIAQYLARVEARPAYVRAMARVQP